MQIFRVYYSSSKGFHSAGLQDDRTNLENRETDRRGVRVDEGWRKLSLTVRGFVYSFDGKKMGFSPESYNELRCASRCETYFFQIFDAHVKCETHDHHIHNPKKIEKTNLVNKPTTKNI
jgi:hypothetical protein